MAETESFHHYQVLRKPDGALWELGRGAMGVTYKAFDTNLRCPVALKVINATYLHSETARARFLREARAAAGLSHPNVAAAFHLGQDEDSYFYAMEFVDGETVDALVKRRGGLPPALALRITLQVARALRAAHRIGLVHRDIKPANLMVMREGEREVEATLADAAARAVAAPAPDEDDEDDIHVKVIDFGLAKTIRQVGGGGSTDAASSFQTMGGFVGTPHFASPEQLEEKEIDARSDIYSLGATLWFMLAGRPPFSGSMAQIMSQHLSRPPAFETLEAAGVRPPVLALLRRMLAKDPAGRPQTPGDLRREIEAALRATQPVATVVPATPPAAAADDPGAATLVDIDSASPTSGPATPPPLPPGTTGTSRPSTSVPPPTPGLVLADRYRLLRSAGPEGGHGQLFQALDLQSQRSVAVKLLPPALAADAALFARLAAEVKKARQPAAVAHPGLIAVHSLERPADRPQALLVSDWVEGFSLLEILRQRQQLTVPEVLAVLDPLAEAADHARACGLEHPDLALGQVLLALEPGSAPPLESTAARAVLLASVLGAWPPFHPRVPPLTLPDPAESAVGEPTWAGGRTLVGNPAAGDAAARANAPAFQRLAILAVELLGGGGAGLASGRFAPLPALTERGNAVLRAAFTPTTASGASFAGAREFVRALREGVAGAGGAGQPGPSALTTPVSAAPLTAVPPPPRPPVPASVAPATVAPPPPQPAAVPVRPRAGLSGLGVAAIVLGVLIALSAAVGALAYYGWRTYSGLTANADQPASSRPRTRPTPVAVNSPAPTPIPTASPVPVASARPVLVPTAEPVLTPTPTPVPTAAPTPDREAGYRAAAVDAQRLEKAGDHAGALEAYLQMTKDFPERDAGRTGLDSVVNSLRAAFPPETEAGARRFRQLRPLVERAAAAGSDAAMLLLGDGLAETDPQTAVTWYRQAAERGQTRAMIALGNLAFRGRGGPADPAGAVRYYEQASDRGDAMAKVYLGECYQEGYGSVRRDYAKAFALYNEALTIDPTNSQALDKLGVCYDKGHGTVPDPRKALEFTRRAADLGNLNALGNLGVFYMNGTGLPKPDPNRAAELFRQGADKDSPVCMFNFAKCLESGLGVGRANPNDARRWYRAAAERGYPPAADWCRRAGVPFTPKAP